MVTRPKRKSPAPAKRAAKARSTTPARPFIRFYHSEALRRKTLAVLHAIEQAEDPTAHRNELADIAVELTNSAFDYCFMRPLKLAKAGFIVEQSAKIGLSGVQQVIGTVLRNIIGRMGGPQLLSVCGSIREFMR